MSATTLDSALSTARSGASFRPHRVTVECYNRMIDAGVFNAKDPVILWKGHLVEKMTKGSLHFFAMTALNVIFTRQVFGGIHVRQEQPILLDDDTVPEPDFTIVRGENDDYFPRMPAARDVALIVEVSESSLAVDSGEVLEAYARNAIPCYWIVNLRDLQIEVYSKPEGTNFTTREVFGLDGIVPIIFGGGEVGQVAVCDVFPSSFSGRARLSE